MQLQEDLPIKLYMYKGYHNHPISTNKPLGVSEGTMTDLALYIEHTFVASSKPLR